MKRWEDGRMVEQTHPVPFGYYCEPNKIWVDKDNKFCNKLMKSKLKKMI